jgi:hypothetical protein
MTITPDGVRAARDKETKFHPTNPDGSPITAWARRTTTLEKTIAEVNKLRDELDGLRADLVRLRGDLVSRPF